MQSRKNLYDRIISTILVICMLVGILPQTVISFDSFSDDDTGESLNQLFEEDILIEEDVLFEENGLVEEGISFDEKITLSEYSSLKGRAKQELIVKYKDSSEKIDIREKTKDPNITSLKSKEKLDAKTELIEINSKDDIGTIIDILEQDPNVEYVQPNYEVTIFAIDDPYIDLQWGIKNNGQSIGYIPGAAGLDINLLPILDMPYINEVIVAVIDTGIEITHEDLAGKINPNGWNFAEGNNNVSDLSGHGTHIAGIIGAVKNNIGVMGVAENVKLMPLKVIENGIGYTSDVIEAIQYAQSMGAKIANCSFGSEYFNYAMYEAMSESDMAFICAAGNTGVISNIYPASYDLPNVLSVTSVNNNGELASNASYGQTVDIAAPGVDIYSTTINNSYTYGDGSSYAAAYATGASARLLGIRDMTAAEVIAVLKQGAVKKDNLTDYVKSGGMLNISNSYDLIQDDLDIVIDIDLDSFEHDEAILQLLEKDYYAMTEDEKERLLDYFRVSRELLEECLAAGYPLSESLSYSENMGKFGFTLNEVKSFYDMYDEAWKADAEFSFLDTLIQRYGVSPEEISDIKVLMFAGQKVKNLIKTYVVSKALGIPIYTLVKKDGNIGESGYMNIPGTDLTDEEKKDIWIFSVNNWADVNVLIDYMAANNLTYIDLWYETISCEDNTIIPLDGDTSKKYPDAPFSYRERVNEKINLNTGSLVYENIDVVLPGKNGMDLVIASRYDSYNANIQDTYLSAPGPASVFTMYRKWEYRTQMYFNNGRPSGSPQSSYYYAGETTRYSEAQVWAAKPTESTTTYTSSGYAELVVTISYGYDTIYPSLNTYTTNLRQSNYDLRNNLGIGWSLGFSYIEITDGNKYLHLDNGTVYMIASTFSSNSSNLLSYSQTDIQILQDSGSFTNGQVSSYYVLKFKSGVNEYFSSDGRLLGRKDRFGNTIKFEHTSINGNYLITKITDTLGRIVTISYPTSSAGGNVVVTLPDNSKVTYVLEKISGYYGTTCKLTQRKDQLNRITSFIYSIDSASEKLRYESANATKYYVNLTKVAYQTGASNEYTYTKKDENVGVTGTTQVYKVSYRLDRQSSSTYNTETYDFGSYTAYPTYSNMNNARSDYTYSTSVKNSATGKIITTTFNKEHLPTSVWTYNSSNVPLLLNIYEYNTYKQMINSAECQSSNDTTWTQSINATWIRSLNNYEYDTKNNITGHWSPLAGGSTKSNEYKATYTYNPTYSYITSKQYKQSSTKTVTEEYTPYTSDTKKIEWKKVYETVGTGAKTLKEATQYFYDGVGNITEERRYYGNLTMLTEYISTQYAYIYNTDGTSTTTITTLSVKNADGGLIGNIANKYEYDKMGRLVKATDGKGYITTYEYDLLGRQTKITNPDNTIKTYVYDDAANTLTETNEKATAVKYFYDGLGNIKSVRDVTSGTDIATFVYDTAFRLKEESTLSASSTTGSKTTYTYDVLDRILTKTVTNASNVVLGKDTYAYATNESHCIVTHIVEGDANSPSIRTRSYTDNMGRVAKQGYYIGSTEYTDDYTYDYVGNKLTVKTAHTKQYWNSYGYTNKWEYDYAGRVAKEYDIFSKYSSFEYNALGQLAYSKDPKANNTSGSLSTEYIYDALGRLIEQKTPFEGTTLSKVKNYYDNNGNMIQQKTMVNAVGASEQWTPMGVAYEYNNRNMLIKVTNYNLGVAASYVQYYYDATGNPLRMYTGHNAALTINGLDNVVGTMQSVTKYEYDRFGNLTKLTDPMGYVETCGYDLLGRMLTKTDRTGNIFTYTHDGLGRLLNTKNGSTTLETYTYTLTGNKRTENNSVGTLTYTYDSLGRVTNVAEPNNVTKTYTYDIGSNRLSSIIKVGTTTTNSTTYTYDEAGRMKTALEGGVLQCTYAYDVNGNRSSMTYNASGVTTDYTYNLANLVKTLTNKKGTTVLSSYSYTYQLDGNQVGKTDHTGKVTSYVYDGLGRLKSESSPGNTITYDIDDASNNRKKMTVNGTVTSYDYDKNNRLKTETTGALVTTYTYDNNGNTLTKKAGVTVTEIYAYDVLNRMASSTVNGVTATYTYRPDGLRYSKTSGGIATIHIWDGSNIVGDVANGVVSVTYVRGIGLIASKIGGAFTYYMYNGHGDVVQLINSSGTAITKSYDYDSFGVEKGQTLYGDVNGDGKINVIDLTLLSQYLVGQNVVINMKESDVSGNGIIDQADSQRLGQYIAEIVVTLGPSPIDSSNPFRYCGEYFDKETGTIYLRARYYNPRNSRWLSEDSARDGTNWYLYCYNNPLRYIDLTGLIPTPLEAAYMAQHVYSPFDNTYYPLIGDWEFENFITGKDTMVMGVYSKTTDGVTEYSLVSKGTLVDFGGKYHDRTITEWINNLQGPFGASKDIKSSITKSTEFVDKHPTAEITFIGHSKGGAEAAANAVANNKNAIVFNPMSVKLNAYMSQETVSNYTSNMTSYVVKGDILNNIFGPISKAIDNLVYLQNQNKTPWYILPGPIRGIANLSNSLKNHSMESMINALKQAGIK